MKDLLVTIGLAIIVIAILLGLCLAIALPLDRLSCNAATQDIGIPHRWGFWSGCQVLEDNKWIPLDNWRYLGNP